jgi:hypothetical protein
MIKLIADANIYPMPQRVDDDQVYEDESSVQLTLPQDPFANTQDTTHKMRRISSTPLLKQTSPPRSPTMVRIFSTVSGC